MRKSNLTLSVAFGALMLSGLGCQNPQEKVVEEKIEAAKEISKAEKQVAETIDKAMKEVKTAPVDEKMEKKIEATEDIAEAEKKIDDAKIEATEEIVDAEQDAGKGGSYTKE